MKTATSNKSFCFLNARFVNQSRQVCGNTHAAEHSALAQPDTAHARIASCFCDTLTRSSEPFGLGWPHAHPRVRLVTDPLAWFLLHSGPTVPLVRTHVPRSRRFLPANCFRSSKADGAVMSQAALGSSCPGLAGSLFITTFLRELLKVELSNAGTRCTRSTFPSAERETSPAFWSARQRRLRRTALLPTPVSSLIIKGKF